MAKIDKTGTLAQMRGRQGGIVLSSNDAAAYAKPWAMPRRPRTYGQWLTTQRWRYILHQWSLQSAEDKELWNTEAQDPLWTRQDWFGQSYQPSGLNLYVMIWMWYFRLGGTTVAPLPSGPLPGGSITCTLTTDGAWTTWANNDVQVTTTQSPGGMYRYVLIDSQPRRGTGTNEMKGQYRPLAQFDLSTGAVQTIYGGNAADGSGFFRNLVLPWRAIFLTDDLKAAPPMYGTYRSPTG